MNNKDTEKWLDKDRCPWADSGKPEYPDYHEREWGVPLDCFRRAEIINAYRK